MIKYHLTALTAEGAVEIQGEAHELLHAMRQMPDLSQHQRDFGAIICTALLREAAEEHLDDLEEAGPG